MLYIEIKLNTIYNMNCLEGLKLLPDNSVDSIVTDPPYELGFMGKAWDSTGIAYNVEMWQECLRVLKPGGHLLAFGGTRTYHRMACAIEDAGFEIRDQIQWIYGSGFPKSMNISKMIDKKAGAEREKIPNPLAKKQTGQDAGKGLSGSKNAINFIEPNPSTDEAKQWDGWGTALKPANEPIVVARKPLSEKTIVDNVLKWGTGGLNIDDCRVEYKSGNDLKQQYNNFKGHGNQNHSAKSTFTSIENHDANLVNIQGRFPANVILDEEAGKMLDEQSGIRPAGNGNGNAETGVATNGQGVPPLRRGKLIPRNDTGGASRFYYCAKASRKERGEGNNHPTVKPLSLIKYLITLVTPPNGICLDPFEGSGTHALACLELGFNYIGFELDTTYCGIANKRIQDIVSKTQ